MELKYTVNGQVYTFGVNANHIKVGITNRFNKGNQPLSQVRWIEVSGDLLGNGQAANILLENALKTALTQNYGDLVFYADDGITVAESLLNSGSITGVRITSGPDFKDTFGPQFATLRSYFFKAEAEYPVIGRANYIFYQEGLTFGGGGPTYAFRRALNTGPQRQQVWPATEYTCQQAGNAEGYLAYPSPLPQPKFPFAMKHAPVIRYLDPTRKGPAGWEGWPITWDWMFEWGSPLVGTPQIWNF